MTKSTEKYNLLVYEEAHPYAVDYLRKNNLAYKVISSDDGIPANEKNIIYKVNKGKFLTPCPGTPKYICCGYYVLSPVENCPFSCTYCILNAYFKNRDIVVYVNTDDMIKELSTIGGKSVKRIGTGEFSDSLAITATRLYLKKTLDFFNNHKEIFLELKTKSSFIPQEFLSKLYSNVIFSWSLNSNKITESEEHDTASISERIASAKKMTEKGYRVSFHFDPIIYYDGWEKDYHQTISEIFSYIKDSDIVWISLGTLRFIPQLKEIATSLYPKTTIFDDEFIKALDGKSRYFRKRRVAIYKKMLSMIKEYSQDVFVYLCMENEDVWQEVFSINMTTKRLKELMDERL